LRRPPAKSHKRRDCESASDRLIVAGAHEKGAGGGGGFGRARQARA
jgi:hypothetical protein